MLPRVILYNGVSLDGRMDWYTGDIGLYYELAAGWEVDAMLSGSNTMLAAFSSAEALEEDEEAFEPPASAPDDPRPLLVVVDSRGRFRHWHRIRKEPYWRDGIALCSHATPPRSIFVAPDLTSSEGVIPLRLTHVETQKDDTVWLRYEVVR